MKREPMAAEAPAPQDVFAALDDPDCREILRRLDTPMAAKELSEACDIPQSTTYRKLDLLDEASLVEERTEIREDGRHTARYVANFDEISVSLDDDGSLDLAIGREESSPEERLSKLWSEVRTET
jgi:DNA-binding transcriptional ArsR family regulator